MLVITGGYETYVTALPRVRDDPILEALGRVVAVATALEWSLIDVYEALLYSPCATLLSRRRASMLRSRLVGTSPNISASRSSLRCCPCWKQLRRFLDHARERVGFMRLQARDDLEPGRPASGD
jgi:hypothetical protein